MKNLSALNIYLILSLLMFPAIVCQAQTMTLETLQKEQEKIRPIKYIGLTFSGTTLRAIFERQPGFLMADPEENKFTMDKTELQTIVKQLEKMPVVSAVEYKKALEVLQELESGR